MSAESELRPATKPWIEELAIVERFTDRLPILPYRPVAGAGVNGRPRAELEEEGTRVASAGSVLYEEGTPLPGLITAMVGFAGRGEPSLPGTEPEERRTVHAV